VTGQRQNSVSRDEGAVAVLVALLMSVLMVLVAFAVDISNAYANARQLSVAVDAAALSAAAKVGEQYTAAFPNADCSSANLTSINATQIATAEADRINSANTKLATTEAVDTVTVTCEDGSKAIQVSITNNREVKTFFAGIIGINSLKPNSYAIARYQKTSAGGGLRPWAVCDTTVRAARNSPGTTFWTPLGNWNNKSGDAGICGTSAPGQWGSVDFDDGGNPAGPLADWTHYGYPGAVTIPDPALPADPGVSNSSALVDAFEYLVGKVVLFPSVSSISGAGNNATFDANGVATVKVCGVYYGNSIYNIDQSTGVASDCWRDPTPTTTSTPTVTSVLGVAMANNSNVVTTTVDDSFVPGMVGGTISVPGAGNNAGTTALTGVIDSVSADGRSATLRNGDKAKRAVVGATATVNWTKVDTVPGSLNVPVSNNGQAVDHIQFRWVNYSTNYSGPGGTTCQLSNPLCVGTTVLWR
jgi:Flp pilus assembly protein TadG